MHAIETEIQIQATATRVWQVLTDFTAYPRWNPFIRSLEGELVVGQTLNASIQPPGSAGMRFRPVLLAADPMRELRWKGKLLLPGVFDGEHHFTLETSANDGVLNGGVLLRHGERFTGLLVPLFRKSLDGATRQGFIAMNEALKKEAESA